jgi:electron transfer flavoprotein beta subunit
MKKLIYVCIKDVPSSENLPAIDPIAGSLECESWASNLLDMYALQAALAISEKTGLEVVAVTAGQPEAAHSLRSALALGAQRGVLISPTSLLLDPETTARTLAKCIKDDADEHGARAELILSGRQSSDFAWMQVHYRLAAQMGFNMVNDAVALEVGERSAHITRNVGTTSEYVEVDLPCVVGMCRGPGDTPRPSLPGLYRARAREISVKTAPVFETHISGPKLIGIEGRPEFRSCRMAEGISAEEKTRHLISMLRAGGHL